MVSPKREAGSIKASQGWTERTGADFKDGGMGVLSERASQDQDTAEERARRERDGAQPWMRLVMGV